MGGGLLLVGRDGREGEMGEYFGLQFAVLVELGFDEFVEVVEEGGARWGRESVSLYAKGGKLLGRGKGNSVEKSRGLVGMNLGDEGSSHDYHCAD